MEKKMTVIMRHAMMRWTSIPGALMVMVLMAIAIFGCGDSNNTPSETVNKLFQLTQERNCQAIADLVTDTYPELADRYVNACKHTTLVSYSIKGETFDTDVFAHVDFEVTIKENGVEKTNSGTRFLVKRGDDWKLTETENRSSKPPN